MKSPLKIVSQQDNYPFKNSHVTATFETEVKRLAEEREESTGDIVRQLAKFTDLSERQIYNLRSGQSQITEIHILKFCFQFGSLALAAAWMCEQKVPDAPELLDVVRLANQSARHTLQCHDQFLAAFDDGVIDGYEYAELNKAAAAGIANFYRLREFTNGEYQRQRSVLR